jgi:hypothetical protein
VEAGRRKKNDFVGNGGGVADRGAGGNKMKIEGYEGICACCFNPIRDGECQKLRENGRNFHKKCIVENPYNYYVKLEKRLLNKQINHKPQEV